jgi:hypothetical protein
MADELNINKEAIHEIPLWRYSEEEKLLKIRPTQTHGWTERTEIHIIPRLQLDLSRQSQLSWLHFLFPKVKTALKGKRVKNVEDIKKNVNWTLFPLEAFADCFLELLKLFNTCVEAGGDYIE